MRLFLQSLRQATFIGATLAHLSKTERKTEATAQPLLSSSPKPAYMKDLGIKSFTLISTPESPSTKEYISGSVEREINLVNTSYRSHPELPGLAAIRFVSKREGSQELHIICSPYHEEELISHCKEHGITFASATSDITVDNPFAAGEYTYLEPKEYRYGPRDTTLFYIKDKASIKALVGLLGDSISEEHRKIFGV